MPGVQLREPLLYCSLRARIDARNHAFVAVASASAVGRASDRIIVPHASDLQRGGTSFTNMYCCPTVCSALSRSIDQSH